MNIEKLARLAYEAFMLGKILDGLPDAPSMREARIQTGKLSRMIEADRTRRMATFRKRRLARTTGAVLGGASLKKQNQEEGRHAQRIGQQERKVRLITDKVFKELLRQDGDHISNAAFREWKRQLDLAMKKSAQRFLEDINKSVIQRIQQLAQGTGRP